MEKITLEFASNFKGLLSTQPEVMAKLIAVIDNTSQETWEEAHGLIISTINKGITLFQAVNKVDYDYPEFKMLDEPWVLPTKAVLLQAIRYAVFKDTYLKLN